MGARHSTAFLASTLLCAALLTLTVSAAHASADYVFNAGLSLTGDCSESTLDPVPDPGCPGGVHPPRPLKTVKGVAIDAHGDRYLSSRGGKEDGSEGRIDIFGPQGEFLDELPEPDFPESLAVDSHGNLYVAQSQQSNSAVLVRYPPITYEPQTGEIDYGAPLVVLPVANGDESDGLAINPQNDHVFIRHGNAVWELNSAAEGNEVVDQTTGTGELYNSHWLAADFARKRLYVSTREKLNIPGTPDPSVVRAFELEAPHRLLATFDGSNTPTETFVSDPMTLPVAVDERTGHLFVGDLGIAHPQVYEFEADGGYVSTISRAGMQAIQGEMKVDNSPASPTRDDLFLPSGQGNPSHSLVFEPDLKRPPEIESALAEGVTEEEAVLTAKVNPEGTPVAYRFEYATEEDFKEEGFAGAHLAGEGTTPPAVEGVAVTAPVGGLQPGTAYRFRVLAVDEEGEDEAQASFATYPAADRSLGCENEALRTGAAAALPDCRAYELVTPAETNGLVPLGFGTEGILFPTPQTSLDGDRLTFRISGGTLPGFEGTGSRIGDSYLSSRGPSGWSTANAGPNGAETPALRPGSASSDQRYSFWESDKTGSASVEGSAATYLRYPDGHSALIGRGSLATDPTAEGELISENGAHVIFATSTVGQHIPRQLEQDAPPDGTTAVYDRTIDQESGEEETHVVSLLPGNVTPSAGQGAHYQGASLDGRGVAFTIGEKLYLRFDDAETYEIGEKLTFEGLSEGGTRIFYLEGGDLFAFDATSGETIRFTESGDVTPVNVSADGSAAYFVSPSALTGAEANPSDDVAQPGQQNLYLSREGAVSFVGTVTVGDVAGEGVDLKAHGLGLWDKRDQVGADPSRTTAGGAVLLFESRAHLTAYDSEGHREVYRYDAAQGTLSCLSCNPTLAAARGDASLESVSLGSFFVSKEPLGPHAILANLQAGGERAFFESPDALVASDTDGVQDVYEWEEDGLGSCRTPGGCTYLVSSGRGAEAALPESPQPNYLFAVSEGGRDVFISTSSRLLPSLDPDETASIYDARVNGGFATPAPVGECLGEACQPAVSPPADPPSGVEGAGNVRRAGGSACRKGRRAVQRHGRLRCLAHHRHHRKHRHPKRRASR